ncbi:MAG: adenylyltransferase/cytidyltransferase family protein [Clostridia bacterium]|nr:adenylyltransferase/cytidyltransferase family protein [Clostridia bacterium]
MKRNMRPYAAGLIVGRFQIFHNGHRDIVRRALKLCERVLVLIGSSQEAGTAKNPLSYNTRRDVIAEIFRRETERGRLIIAPLPDLGVGNVPAWGSYVYSAAEAALGKTPELFVTGREERRISWFDDIPAISELYVPKTVDISATQMREFLAAGEVLKWRIFSDPANYHRFDELREAVLRSAGNNDTASM